MRLVRSSGRGWGWGKLPGAELRRLLFVGDKFPNQKETAHSMTVPNTPKDTPSGRKQPSK